ncbi:MAG: ABC transporter ATP-binding protein [Pseudomonadota bacterium]
MNRVIEAKKISRRFSTYRQDVLAVPEVSLCIDAGDLFLLTGPSGSGKSTLLNILSTLDTPSTGDVILNGTHLSSCSDDDLAAIRNEQYGFVFQTPHLIPHQSVLENVLLPTLYGNEIKPKDAKTRALELLDYVGLIDAMDHYPATLSGGELQRVVFARALIRQPDVIFADEPTGSLDADNSHRLLELLKDQAGSGKVVVMATHDRVAMSYATRSISLDKFDRDAN